MSMTVIFSDLGDADCGTLPLLWRNIPDVKLLKLTRGESYTQDEIREAIRNEKDTLLICGHGTSSGLIGFVSIPVEPEDDLYHAYSHRRRRKSQMDDLHDAYANARGDSVGALGELRDDAEAQPAEKTRNYTTIMGTPVDGSMAKEFNAERVICIWCHASDYAKKHKLYGFWSSMFISNSLEARCCGFVDVPNEVILAECRKFMRDVNLLIRKDVPQEEWIDKLMAIGDLDYPTTAYNYDGLCYFPKH